MRTLYVSFFHVWPGQSGWGIRLRNTVEALATLGPVDFLCLDRSDRPRDAAPEGVRVIDVPEGPAHSVREWGPRWVTGDLPRQIAQRDFEAAASRIPDVLDGPYDAVVVPFIHAWPAIADVLPTPVILDLGDLVDGALRSRREAGLTPREQSPVGRAGEWLRWHAVTLADRVDERRYARLQREAAERCDRVFVCSELDVARSGFSNAVEVPNGYERTIPPRGAATVTDPDSPVFVFVGVYTYPPNVDAVRWFIGEVLPAIRRDVPGARFRVIGETSGAFDDLADEPGVELVGWVDDVAPEITAADVVVVPLHVGSGTRLKVVEAMANRVPMVSTSIGCEGIDVVDGEHLLIADTAASFASASVRLVVDEELRASLADAAEQRFLQRYQWSTIRELIAAEVLDVSGVADDRG